MKKIQWLSTITNQFWEITTNIFAIPQSQLEIYVNHKRHA